MKHRVGFLLGMMVLLAVSSAALAQRGTPPPLSSGVKDALAATLLDEYRAEAAYRAVIKVYGPVTPFVEIAEAEVQHQTVLLRLFDKYGLTPPANPYDPDSITVPDTLAACCELAVEAEWANIALYNSYLTTLPLPRDVKQVFTNLRNASLYKHLPAFQKCAAGDCPDCPKDGTGPGPGPKPGPGPRLGGRR